MQLEQNAFDGHLENQRNVLLVDATNGCGGYEGSTFCTNWTVASVSNSGGQLVLNTNASNHDQYGVTDDYYGGPRIWVQGVGGNVPDGTYTRQNFNGVTCDNCSISLHDTNGNPIPYTTGYTGGGSINHESSVDMYVMWDHVFTCASWQTTLCRPGQ
jgi:hypothetical protein